MNVHVFQNTYIDFLCNNWKQVVNLIAMIFYFARIFYFCIYLDLTIFTHPSNKFGWRKSWSCRPNQKVHHVCHIGDKKIMVRSGQAWCNPSYRYKFHSRSPPTVQRYIRWSTPNFRKCCNHIRGPQAPNNWKHWRYLHRITLQQIHTVGGSQEDRSGPPYNGQIWENYINGPQGEP